MIKKVEKLMLNKYTGGWLVGDFLPSLIRTKDVEVGVKKITKGTVGDGHYHKLVTEYTIIISGKLVDKGVEYSEADIIILQPYEKNFTRFITDSIIISIKSRSVANDKYF